MSRGEARQKIPLEAFLDGLAEEDAGAARQAARRIDALEREVGPPGWLERNLVALGLGGLLLFSLGVVLLVLRAGGMVTAVGLATIVPLLAAFPALVLAYLWSVRGRTRVDREKMELNERHFLPHGGVYFGAREGSRTVTRVPPRTEEEPTLKERAERLHAQATRRRWWW